MRSIVRQLLNQPTGFSPRQLFTALQGAWLEPKVELGSELIEQPVNFAAWTATTGGTPTNTGSAFTTFGAAGGYIKNVLTAGKTYVVSISGTTTVSGGITLRLSNLSANIQISSGFGTAYFTVPAGYTYFYVRNEAGGTTTITSLSVREVTSGTNIWQENTGITPTTTGGRTIGLLLDQSQGLVLGPELVSNGTFDTNTTGWTAYRNASIAAVGGRLRVTEGVNNASGVASTPITFTVGNTYLISVDIPDKTASFAIIRLIDVANATNIGTTYIGNTNVTSSTYVVRWLATVSSAYLSVQLPASAIGAYADFDNISVREILGNHAYQATANQRPLLGRRYNLLTYSEDFSNAAWTADSLTPIDVTPNYEAGPFGRQAQRLADNSNSVGCRKVQSAAISANTLDYTLSAIVKYIDSTVISLRINTQTGGTEVSNLLKFNPQTGAIVSGTGVVQDLGGGWYKVSVSVTNNGANTFVVGKIYATDSAVSAATGSVSCAGIDLRLTADVGKDPSYQRITTATDYDYGQYPAAVHDTTDSLVVSLPSINVRRNLLTYSEQFDNGAWTKLNASITPDSALAPDGSTTADKLVDNAVNTQHGVSRIVAATAANYTMSVYAKAGERSLVSFLFAGYTYATFNLTAGTTGTSGASITPAGNGWFRCVFTASVPDTIVRGYIIYTNNGSGITYAGDGTSGIYIWGAQLELGSVATDYQKITDWTSEAYASSGSVYFATPVGMSALHNQSMGTTYTLPALSSDIYSWIVVPQRLNAAQESRLARYMERKAGIAGPDYFEQEDYGPELVTNGDFSNGTTGWIISSDFIVTNGQAERVTNTGAKGVVQTNILQIGTTYRCSINIKQLSGGDVRVLFYVGANFITFFSPGIKTFNAVCTVAGSIYIYSTANTCILDDISVRELKDGMTGQLTADDGEQLLLAQ